MNTAEHIFQEVRSLPEAQAQEVLDFVARLKARTIQRRRDEAFRTLAKYRGRFTVMKTQRDELYDRKGIC